MKTSQIIVLAGLMVIMTALGMVGAYVLAYGQSTVSNSYTPNTGVYGYNNYPSGMMSGGMGMMGGNNGASSSTQNPVPVQNPATTIIGLIALGGSFIAGTGGLAYVFSVRREKPMPTTIESHVEEPIQNIETPYASVSKTLTVEERKVLDVLVSHDGKYLQKHIRAETGLSRLKTHRIIARLAERGVVTLEKQGNTNEVQLSSWLKNSNAPEQNSNANLKEVAVSI